MSSGVNTAEEVKKRYGGVVMWKGASESVEGRLVAGYIVSPAELRRIQDEARALPRDPCAGSEPNCCLAGMWQESPGRYMDGVIVHCSTCRCYQPIAGIAALDVERLAMALANMDPEEPYFTAEALAAEYERLTLARTRK